MDTPNNDNQLFQKVMVVPDSGTVWMVALCRSGFASPDEAMRWALDYMKVNASDTEISDIFRDAFIDDEL